MNSEGKTSLDGLKITMETVKNAADEIIYEVTIQVKHKNRKYRTQTTHEEFWTMQQARDHIERHLQFIEAKCYLPRMK